ncbi:MAG: OsmC family protein [Vulcanimicrobiaceae bacterium]
MNSERLRAVQAPLKDRYRADPQAALFTLKAAGRIDDPEGLSCSVETGRALVKAGLHPASGGDATVVCSGDMLLQALVACAGVTLRAVATAKNVRLRGGTIQAEGDLDFRGTLGIDRAVPVGFTNIRLRFDLDADATPEEAATLHELTERYCVVYQTLANGVKPEVDFRVESAQP